MHDSFIIYTNTFHMSPFHMPIIGKKSRQVSFWEWFSTLISLKPLLWSRVSVNSSSVPQQQVDLRPLISTSETASEYIYRGTRKREFWNKSVFEKVMTDIHEHKDHPLRDKWLLQGIFLLNQSILANWEMVSPWWKL